MPQVCWICAVSSAEGRKPGAQGTCTGMSRPRCGVCGLGTSSTRGSAFPWTSTPSMKVVSSTRPSAMSATSRFGQFTENTRLGGRDGGNRVRGREFLDGLRPAVAQFHDAVLQALGAHREAQGEAQQVRVLELRAGAEPFALVVEHLEAGLLQRGFQLAGDLGDLLVGGVEAEEVHLEGRDGPGPEDAILVVVLLDGGGHGARDADAVAAH